MSEAPSASVDFPTLYRRYFRDCCRWVRAMGAPASDIEDLAQEVFLVVRRKLGDEQIERPAAWIYRIAWQTVSDHRRRSWWKNLFSRRGVATEADLISTARGPLETLEQAERRRVLEQILGRMSSIRRTTFVLFEIEGYSGEEIAALQGIPVDTVWTRLHHARRSFLALAAAERERIEHVRREEEPST